MKATGQAKHLSVVFDHAVTLGLLLDVSDLKNYEGPWICKVDDRWTFAINGLDKPVAVDLGEGSMGIEKLERFHMAIWFNGWLAGIIHPFGGIICAGEAGNEDELIKALEARIGLEKLAKELQPT